MGGVGGARQSALSVTESALTALWTEKNLSWGCLQPAQKLSEIPGVAAMRLALPFSPPAPREPPRQAHTEPSQHSLQACAFPSLISPNLSLRSHKKKLNQLLQ